MIFKAAILIGHLMHMIAHNMFSQHGKPCAYLISLAVWHIVARIANIKIKAHPVAASRLQHLPISDAFFRRIAK
ncbi:MAG: hypothetical protein IKK17_06740, partial [Oscillospiraceae bacterium]|nr:hypothetical protein [Oscillospiraceae bacterium]